MWIITFIINYFIFKHDILIVLISIGYLNIIFKVIKEDFN